jgi:hypothetical protein
MAVSFIGGGNWSTWRKPLTCRKSLTNNVISSTPRHERGKKTDSFPKDLLVIISKTEIIQY